LRDIDWYSASISIIQKKTGKQVSIPFSERTGDALADYILNARGTSSLPYVFLKKSYCDSSLTSSLLCQRLKKLMQRAGITRPAAEKINMHTFRRSLGTSLIDSGESLEMVAQILGHKDIEATKRYISVSEQMLRSCPMPMPEINERAESNE
ncbi:MAG TPA: tyrosine-type recombinase/integrase, partial [Candidatus Blautia intestinipullorum]|nr:tyrosine-type recombinase/integrase [Candidatus Blautia intestinipullorum]